MVTFIVCLAMLVIAYFTYGRYIGHVCELDATNPVPSKSRYDGVDYMPLPRWKIFLIQLLNIAGLGPIFGAVLGAAYGPVAFIWITLGGIFIGAMHDMIAGIMSLRHDGMSLPEIIGEYLGTRTKQFMGVFSVLLMVLVGAVFLSQPANLIDYRLDIPALETIAFGSYSWLLLIILAVCLYIMFRKKGEIFVRPKEPAHIVALRELDKYRGKEMWAPAKQKAFYSGVTDALREYISERYEIGAMEMTTSELFEDMKKTDAPIELVAEVRQLFERADYVKFAKFVASDEENATALPVAVRFVTQTYQNEIEALQEHEVKK
jgi:hypothetical protein